MGTTLAEPTDSAGVSLLTGGPGTGKSRTVASLVQLLQAKGTEVALAAPTGRAAKRLEELTDHPAVTVHRLLGAQGTTGGFSRNEEWPLDADVVVVDEASMLDVELTAALLEACKDGTHLLLVGDPAQLPSIGPGHVLGDLIDSGAVPVTELTTLHRQAAGGAIARLATGVRGGVAGKRGIGEHQRRVEVVEGAPGDGEEGTGLDHAHGGAGEELAQQEPPARQGRCQQDPHRPRLAVVDEA